VIRSSLVSGDDLRRQLVFTDYSANDNRVPSVLSLGSIWRHFASISLAHTAPNSIRLYHSNCSYIKKGSPYSITERRVPELIPVLGSQPAGDVSHKPGCRLPLLSARPAVTSATLKRAATNVAAWWTEARWVWTVCLRLLPYSVAAAIWTRAILRLSPAC